MADGVELMIIVTSTFAQTLAGSGPTVDIIGVLTFWRFIMGVGIGGDYPLSAVIASEFAATRSRGRLMTAVFSSQGWGYLGKRASHVLKEHYLRFASFHSRGTGYRRLVQKFHPARLANKSRAHRLLLADPHRCGLCARRHRTVFPAYSPRNSALHHGYRA